MWIVAEVDKIPGRALLGPAAIVVPELRNEAAVWVPEKRQVADFSNCILQPAEAVDAVARDAFQARIRPVHFAHISGGQPDMFTSLIHGRPHVAMAAREGAAQGVPKGRPGGLWNVNKCVHGLSHNRIPMLHRERYGCQHLGLARVCMGFPASWSCAGDSGRIRCSAASMALLIVIFDM